MLSLAIGTGRSLHDLAASRPDTVYAVLVAMLAAMPLRQDNWRDYVPPEAKAPEAKAPESKAPETKAPESKTAATPVRNRRIAKTGMLGTNAQANVPNENTTRAMVRNNMIASARAML